MSSNTESENVVADLKRHIFVFVMNDTEEPAVAHRLTEAYDRLKSLEISVSWHQTTKSLPSQDANYPVVFVMEPFGTAFFQEIRHDFRIISPICLFTCINLAIKIPISSCRCLANLALRKCIVSSSCFTRDEVVEIEQRVKLMGGVYSGKFMNNTTHLITDEVHSQKYSSAYIIGTPVVLRSWLDEAWTLGCSNPKFTALNRSFTKLHSCPVFSKCNVVVTTFIGTEREEVISLLQVNGAKYSDNIVVEGEHQTTHLVAKRSGSQKYASAVQGCLRIVSKEWVTNCIEEGYRLPERDYQIETKSITAVSKTGSTESEEISETLNQLKLELGPCEPILDGCKVYLCGFSEPQLQRVKKILNMCKATRLNKLSADVTHAVLGCPTPEQCSQISRFTPPPSHVIKYNWLVECWRQKAVVPEYDYLVNLADRTGEGASSRAKSFGLRQREDTQSSPNSELFSQYIKEEKILSNYNFLLIDPEPSLEEAAKKLILTNGGNLISQGSSSVANYTVVPVDFLHELSVTTLLVTLFWLESSLFAKRLLPQDLHPLYAPAQDFGCKDVLSFLVVSLLMGGDRYVKCVSVIQLLRYMGAKSNSQLKKTPPDRTELVITDDPDQETVRQATEWNIPVVHLEWLFQCAKKKQKLPFNSYLLSPSSQPTIDSPPRSPALLSSDRSKIFVLDPAFELEDAEVYFPHGTTPHPNNPTKSKSVNSQLAEMYTRNLETLNIRDFVAKLDCPETTNSLNISKKEPISDVLKRTNVTFASRFTPQELTQMTNIISELGGVLCSSYSSKVTHYIYVDKHNSWSKEAILAKKDNKYVVHPQWLSDAKRFGRLQDEINYPPSFDPNKSIGYFKIEKLPEPESRDLPEPMDTAHTPELIMHSTRAPTDDSTDDKSGLAMCIGDITLASMTQKHQQIPIGSVRKKRMRMSSEENIFDPHQFDVNLSKITHQPPESNSPRFKVDLSTQEVYDNFDIQCRELREAELSPLAPPSLQSQWKKTDNISEFKMPRESRRFSSLYHQKKSLVQNYHFQQETRQRVCWDPLPYLEDSPPQIPSKDTAADSKLNTDSPEIPNLDTVPSRQSSRRLRNSSSIRSTSVRTSNSSSSSSQSQGHFFIFSNISTELRINMGKIVTKLGGKYLSSVSYDLKCTHMICGEMISREKLFCGMAAGVYILRPEFINRCEKENQFVCEEPFEWGNTSSSFTESTNRQRAIATFLWRKKLEDPSQIINESAYLRRPGRLGAFEDWVVYLACKACKIKECRIESFYQIILAGKGKTTNSLNKRSGITIAVLEDHSIHNTLLKQLKDFAIPAVMGKHLIEYLDSGGDMSVMEKHRSMYIANFNF